MKFSWILTVVLEKADYAASPRTFAEFLRKIGNSGTRKWKTWSCESHELLVSSLYCSICFCRPCRSRKWWGRARRLQCQLPSLQYLHVLRYFMMLHGITICKTIRGAGFCRFLSLSLSLSLSLKSKLSCYIILRNFDEISLKVFKTCICNITLIKI